MTKHNRAWVRLIWEHQRRQKSTCGKAMFTQVDFGVAVRATIALYLNLWARKLPESGTITEVAWRDLGQHSTDYGIDQAWATLVVVGFRVFEFDDGSL